MHPRPIRPRPIRPRPLRPRTIRTTNNTSPKRARVSQPRHRVRPRDPRVSTTNRTTTNTSTKRPLACPNPDTVFALATPARPRPIGPRPIRARSTRSRVPTQIPRSPSQPPRDHGQYDHDQYEHDARASVSDLAWRIAGERRIGAAGAGKTRVGTLRARIRPGNAMAARADSARIRSLACASGSYWPWQRDGVKGGPGTNSRTSVRFGLVSAQATRWRRGRTRHEFTRSYVHRARSTRVPDTPLRSLQPLPLS